MSLSKKVQASEAEIRKGLQDIHAVEIDGMHTPQWYALHNDVCE